MTSASSSALRSKPGSRGSAIQSTLGITTLRKVTSEGSAIQASRLCGPIKHTSAACYTAGTASSRVSGRATKHTSAACYTAA